MIFLVDLDGTIIDSFKRHYLLLQRIIDSRGVNYKINVDEYILCKRKGINNVDFLKTHSKLPESDICNIQREWVENIENEKWLLYDELFSDSIEFLDYLHGQGFKIIFLTCRNNVEGVLNEIKRFNLNKYAQDILVVNNEKYGTKEKAIQDIFKLTNNITIIGDSENDYNAAKHIGCKFYILNRGFRSENYFSNKGLNKTYDKLNDIISEIERCK